MRDGEHETWTKGKPIIGCVIVLILLRSLTESIKNHLFGNKERNMHPSFSFPLVEDCSRGVNSPIFLVYAKLVPMSFRTRWAGSDRDKVLRLDLGEAS